MVALKVLTPGVATDELRERFRREAMAASALNHPGICTIHDFLQVEGRHLIVMELVAGCTLLEVVSGGPLPPAEAAAIAVQIAAALSEAHRAGILHRDVKSGNIMLTLGGQVKVLDFGLAKRVGASGDAIREELTREGMAVGTLSHMSPEQLVGQRVDERSDLFSLGVVLYEIVAGRRPFGGSSAIATADAILHSTPPPLGGATVPERLEAAIRRLLEKDPARRFGSAQELIAESGNFRRTWPAGYAGGGRDRRWRSGQRPFSSRPSPAAGSGTEPRAPTGRAMWPDRSSRASSSSRSSLLRPLSRRRRGLCCHETERSRRSGRTPRSKSPSTVLRPEPTCPIAPSEAGRPRGRASGERL
jgi:serine/threonine protein kinase